MNSGWHDQQKEPGIPYLCLSTSKIINSELSREPDSRGLFKIPGRVAASWVCEVSSCRERPSFPHDVIPVFTPRVLEKAQARRTALSPGLWLPSLLLLFGLNKSNRRPVIGPFGGAQEQEGRGRGLLVCVAFRWEGWAPVDFLPNSEWASESLSWAIGWNEEFLWTVKKTAFLSSQHKWGHFYFQVAHAASISVQWIYLCTHM